MGSVPLTGFERCRGNAEISVRSDLSHWRKRLGDKLELLLAESLRVAHQSGALRTRDLKRVTVDTTVQPKAITFPTDAKLLHEAIKGLNRVASKHAMCGCGNPICRSCGNSCWKNSSR